MKVHAGETIQSKSVGGHVGRDKTIQKLVDANMWWPRMNIDARQFVKTCAQCQRGNTRFDKAATKLHPIPTPSKVWYQIGVDLGSLPHADEGFVCVCVVVDYFSKRVEAKPLKAKTAHEVAVFLYELICRHGCTCIQINDQGREFCNACSFTYSTKTYRHYTKGY